MKMLTQIGSTTVFLMTFNFAVGTFAQSSGEFSCRAKAKEIAADTYRTCMTDQRQTQLEQIRKDYKEKLSELKSHYDNELKKISAGGAVSNTAPSNSVTPEPNRAEKVKPESKKSARSTTRPSGARSLPPKKGPVKSQSIDLSTPTVTDQSSFEGQSIEPLQAETRLKADQDGSNDMELVELPIQE